MTASAGQLADKHSAAHSSRDGNIKVITHSGSYEDGDNIIQQNQSESGSLHEIYECSAMKKSTGNLYVGNTKKRLAENDISPPNNKERLKSRKLEKRKSSDKSDKSASCFKNLDVGTKRKIKCGERTVIADESDDEIDTKLLEPVISVESSNENDYIPSDKGDVKISVGKKNKMERTEAGELCEMILV